MPLREAFCLRGESLARMLRRPPDPPRGRAPSRVLVCLLLLLVALSTVAAQTIVDEGAPPEQNVTDPVGIEGAGPVVDIIPPTTAIPAKARETVFFLVENEGPGDISDVDIAIRSAGGSSLVVLGRIERDLGVIAEDDEDVVGVLVATPDEPGGASILVTLDYTDDAGEEHIVTRELNLQIAPERSDPLVVEYLSGELLGGTEGLLRFRVSNVGESDVRNLDIRLVLGDSTPQVNLDLPGVDDETDPAQISSGAPSTSPLAPDGEGARILRAGRLEPGESRLVEAPVKTALGADELLVFSLAGHYSYEGYERAPRFDFGVRLEGGVRVRLLDLREERVGDRMELVGSLVNVGQSTAWNPVLRVPPGSGYASREQTLLEDLEPNEAVNFRIPVIRTSELRENDTVPVLALEWNDAFGAVRRSSVGGAIDELPDEALESPYSPRSLARNPWAVGAAAMAAFLVVASLVRAQKRRREEEEA